MQGARIWRKRLWAEQQENHETMRIKSYASVDVNYIVRGRGKRMQKPFRLSQ